MKNPIIKKALLNALGTVMYIAAISSFLFYAPKLSGSGKETVIIPIIMLCLFVFSAAVTGSLIFGQPIIWYLDGRKKEAFSLLSYTLGIFLIIILITLLVWLMI